MFNLDADLINGNINRMILTHNVEELKDMYIIAMGRLKSIYDTNKSRIEKEDK